MNIQLIRTTFAARWLGHVQRIPPPDLDEWVSGFRALTRIDRFTAIHCLSMFPAPLFPEVLGGTEKEAVIVIQDFYQAVVTWLYVDVLKIPKPVALEASHWKDYRCFSEVAKFRLEMVSAIFEAQTAEMEPIYGTPAFVWLLCEAAVCRQMLESAGIIGQPQLKALTKKQLYANNKSDIDALWIPIAPVASRSPKYPLEGITQFDRVMDLEGYRLAVTDKSFDRKYFRPYMEARRQWNVECFLNKNLQIFQLA